jgi:hypothetical protein
MTQTGTETIAPTPAEPVITAETKYGSKNYKLLIGFVKNAELPQYLVKNIETGVIEFNHEVLSFAREWINHFQARLDALDQGKNPDAVEAGQAGILNTANFN